LLHDNSFALVSGLPPPLAVSSVWVILDSCFWLIDLLHKSEKGEAFADKNPDFTDKSGRKCFAPTAKNRLLQEV
jgi:hypothetical protein